MPNKGRERKASDSPAREDLSMKKLWQKPKLVTMPAYRQRPKNEAGKKLRPEKMRRW